MGEMTFYIAGVVMIYLTVVDSNKVKNLERHFIANQGQLVLLLLPIKPNPQLNLYNIHYY